MIPAVPCDDAAIAEAMMTTQPGNFFWVGPGGSIWQTRRALDRSGAGLGYKINVVAGGHFLEVRVQASERR